MKSLAAQHPKWKDTQPFKAVIEGDPKALAASGEKGPEREWAYDRTSHIGRLDKALDEGTAKGWAIVDMKRDWRKVFAFEP